MQSEADRVCTMAGAASHLLLACCARRCPLDQPTAAAEQENARLLQATCMLPLGVSMLTGPANSGSRTLRTPGTALLPGGQDRAAVAQQARHSLVGKHVGHAELGTRICNSDVT